MHFYKPLQQQAKGPCAEGTLLLCWVQDDCSECLSYFESWLFQVPSIPCLISNKRLGKQDVASQAIPLIPMAEADTEAEAHCRCSGKVVSGPTSPFGSHCILLKSSLECTFISHPWALHLVAFL